MARDQIKRLQKQRVRIDRRITSAITFGGWLVLVTLLILIWHLFSVTQPLLSNPDLRRHYEVTLAADERLFSVQSRLNAHQIFLRSTDSCEVRYLTRTQDGKAGRTLLEGIVGYAQGEPDMVCKKVTWDASHDENLLFELSVNNLLRVWTIDPMQKGIKKQVFSVRLPATIQPSPEQQWQPHLGSDTVSVLIKSISGLWHFLVFDRQSRHLTRHVKNINLADKQLHRIENHKINVMFAEQHLLMVSHDQEQVFYYRGAAHSKIQAAVSLSTNRSFLLITEDLSAEKWSLVNNDGDMVLQQLYQFQLPGEDLQHLAHVEGDLVMAIIDDQEHYINATTGEVIGTSDRLPQFDHIVVRNTDLWVQTGRTLQHWKIENPASVVSFASLWHEIWYDGYPEPDYIWQTSSASDQAQAKYSLVPLLMGSIKAAFLAILVAIPLAIGSAIYTAYYAGPKVRRIVKPYVEILEAVPSVVIGFLAAIWLLPVSEKYLLAVLLFLLLTPLLLLLFVWLNESNRHRNWFGWELLFFTLFLFVFLALFQWLVADNPAWLQRFWNSETGGVFSTELKNTFVLAIALGIAIIPTVFTIAEDAIYQVPSSLSRASFAMGASRTQTLLRIVLKVALPGILSAVMLGFARAIGETMIVLMVSGNTPVADWSLLEGMRSMTATLAIELPEAQPETVHYQVLFFIALLLFLFTFVFNTLAEFLRIRLRHRYKI